MPFHDHVSFHRPGNYDHQSNFQTDQGASDFKITHLVVPLVTTLSPVMEISQRMVRVSLGKRFNWGCRNSECDTNLEHTSVRWARTMRCEAENNRHPLCESPVVTGQVLLKSVFTTLGPCLHPVFVHNTEDDVCINGNLENHRFKSFLIDKKKMLTSQLPSL